MGRRLLALSLQADEVVFVFEPERLILSAQAVVPARDGGLGCDIDHVFVPVRTVPAELLPIPTPNKIDFLTFCADKTRFIERLPMNGPYRADG